MATDDVACTSCGVIFPLDDHLWTSEGLCHDCWSADDVVCKSCGAVCPADDELWTSDSLCYDCFYGLAPCKFCGVEVREDLIDDGGFCPDCQQY